MILTKQRIHSLTFGNGSRWSSGTIAEVNTFLQEGEEEMEHPLMEPMKPPEKDAWWFGWSFPKRNGSICRIWQINLVGGPYRKARKKWNTHWWSLWNHKKRMRVVRNQRFGSRSYRLIFTEKKWFYMEDVANKSGGWLIQEGEEEMEHPLMTWVNNTLNNALD